MRVYVADWPGGIEPGPAISTPLTTAAVFAVGAMGDSVLSTHPAAAAPITIAIRAHTSHRLHISTSCGEALRPRN
jgi:hypothetical protein